MCACSLKNLVCKAHAPFYVVVCGLSGSTMLCATLSRKRHYFMGKVIEYKMCVLIFSITFVSKHFSFLDKLSAILL